MLLTWLVMHSLQLSNATKKHYLLGCYLPSTPHHLQCHSFDLLRPSWLRLCILCWCTVAAIQHTDSQQPLCALDSEDFFLSMLHRKGGEKNFCL